jgi:L-seryl-tRNA(Ser) seleniumtransferase
MTFAALEATLRLYADPERAVREVPTLRMLSTPVAELRARAERLAAKLRTVGGLATIELVDDVAYVGGGSLPDQALPTVVVAVTAKAIGDAELATRLRTGTPAVVGRVQGGKLLLDMRTVFERQEDGLIQALSAAVGS